ncbi:Ig-like domain-containing protein [Agromyces sp. MMS24-JH15]|uniref:Ig-like domain-containing protein n=1 Tax=Agromyces sp. MMS24-JH15 TaxID=3243765 RepID=UPI003749097B
MAGRFAYGTRSGLVTAAATVVAVVAVGAAAVVSGGYAEEALDLGDGSVWVVNDGLEAVGRAGTAVHELTSLIDTGATSTEIVQRGATVLVHDTARAAVGIVDPANAVVVKSIFVPGEDTRLDLADDRVVISADGDIWTTPIDQFTDFDADSDPALSFGSGTLMSIDDAGTAFAYVPHSGEVSRIRVDARTAVTEQWDEHPVEEGAAVQLTSVGGHWAILDSELGELVLADRTIDVAELLGTDATPVLQAASSTGDAVVIATSERLVSVPIDGRAPAILEDGRTGSPAQPVVHDGCLHEAWTDGVAWRRCGDDVRRFSIGSAGGSFAFRANGQVLVLNDPATGRTWAASDDYGPIDNWDDLLATIRDDQTVESQEADPDPTVERSQQPPVATPDDFGARPGRSTLLPVLLNDYDVNADVLVVSSVDGVLPEGVTVVPVADRQVLQITLDPSITDPVSFGYTITDGQGNADSTQVSVAIRGPDDNGEPVQQRRPTSAVQTGARLTVPVLGEWVDPDGDPMYLRSASVDAPDRVTFSPDGVVVFDELTGTPSIRSVGLVVSDGRSEGTGELRVDVRAPGEAPLVADPFVVLATAGEEVELEPLRHVRGGSGHPRLTAVPTTSSDVKLLPDFDGGTIRFSSDVPRTHLVEYSVADGGQTTTGLIRVEVSAPPERDTTPITVPHTAFLRVGQPGEVDVLAGDIDPTGGVLVITRFTVDARDVAVQAEIVEHGLLRVTLGSPLEAGSAELRYIVSNGVAEAEGRVTLIEVEPPAVNAPPVANEDRASARVGDVIDIDVLGNDEHPDGQPIEVAPVLVQEPEEGLLFSTGDRLRYFAPDEPGDYLAEYRVDAPDGQYATARVTISVRAADPETNAPPVPAEVSARALAGESVRINIPLRGVDADGDSVELLGLDTSPELGVVTDRGATWLEYEATAYSSGTDTFRYAVVDALGEKAIGVIRVGIAERSGPASSPIALTDEVLARPGRTIAVRVLANDSDPDGGALSLAQAVAPTEDTTAEVDGDLLLVRLPDREDTFGFQYVVRNERGLTASAFLQVTTSAAAPLARPEAADTVLTLTDILDRDTVDVDVLRNLYIADAPVGEAGVEIVEGYGEGARVLADGSVRVRVQDRRQIIPVRFSHPDDATNAAYAFVWVPGREDALPQLRTDAPDLRVKTGEEIEIALEDFVIAASGKPVRIADPGSVTATHSDESDLVVDGDTLRFRSAPGYFGPAALSFTATDGQNSSDPDARTGTIVIPIQVLPAEDQPPRFDGTVIDIQPGQSKTLDLVLLTTTANPSTTRLAYRIVEQSRGFSAELTGTKLVVTAAESTPVKETGRILIAISDGSVAGTQGSIDLRVVPSTRPIARPVDDFAVAARGDRTVVDVLANDEAGNPFPDRPLRVVTVSGIDDASLPAGLRVQARDDRSSLIVTAAADTPPVNATVRYQVADATGVAERYAWGTVVISVQDRPDPVGDLRLVGFDDRRIDLAFAAGGANNSPITGYRVDLVDPAGGAIVGGADCQATTCSVSTPGNGQSNGVIVRVTARNQIGPSAGVTLPNPVWSDIIPAAPANLAVQPLDGRLGVSWSPVRVGPGSSVRSYVVTVAGVAVEVSPETACTATQCVIESQPIPNGSLTTVSVSARNQAYPALAVWNEATANGMPFGAPIPGAVSAVADDLSGTVTVSWAPFDANGDAIGGYFVQRLVPGDHSFPSGPQACSVTSPAPGSLIPPAAGGNVAETIATDAATTTMTFAFSGGNAGQQGFVVWGWNRAACTHTDIAQATVRPPPGPVDSVASTMDWRNDTIWDRRIDSVGTNARTVQIVAVDAGGAQIGAPRSFSGSGWLRDLLAQPYGATARFQVRACAPWGICGPWSAAMPDGSSPSLTFDVPGLSWNDRDREWSWAADPDNSGLPAVYRCGAIGESGGPAEDTTRCRVTGSGDGSGVWLDVEVAGVTATVYGR